MQMLGIVSIILAFITLRLIKIINQYARHCLKCFSFMFSLNLCNNPKC